MSDFEETPQEEHPDPFKDPFFRGNEKGEKEDEKTFEKDEKYVGAWGLESDGNFTRYLFGFLLILAGGLWIVDTVFEDFIFNWWAIFILFPGLSMLYAAYRIYQHTSSLGAAARGPLVGGLVVTGVAFILMFDLPWEFFIPGLLILAGIMILIRMAK